MPSSMYKVSTIRPKSSLPLTSQKGIYLREEKSRRSDQILKGVTVFTQLFITRPIGPNFSLIFFPLIKTCFQSVWTDFVAGTCNFLSQFFFLSYNKTFSRSIFKYLLHTLFMWLHYCFVICNFFFALQRDCIKNSICHTVQFLARLQCNANCIAAAWKSNQCSLSLKSKKFFFCQILNFIIKYYIVVLRIMHVIMALLLCSETNPV